MNPYYYNPQKLTADQAKYVISVLDSEIEASKNTHKIVKEQADSVLDVFMNATSGNTPELDSFLLLFASAVSLGFEDCKLDNLERGKKQFISFLPYRVKQELGL